MKNRSLKIFGTELESERQFKAYQLKRINHIVTAQAISDNGMFLFAGNLQGEVFVQNLRDFDDETTELPTRPKVYNVHAKVISLLFFEDHLIVGSLGELFALEWNEKRQTLSTSHSWTIKLPLQSQCSSYLIQTEVNCMRLRPNSKRTLLIGCGDNKCYEIDLKKQVIKRTYEGHTNYIHDLRFTTDGRLLTASEDGTVRMWHENNVSEVQSVCPENEVELKRNEYGKFIGALDVSEQFMVCGGGPRPGIFHLDSFRLIGSYDFPGPVHILEMIDDTVFIAGMSASACSFSLCGKKKSDMKINIPGVYSMVRHQKPNKFMSLAGCSNELHILTENNLLDFKVELYGPYIAKRTEVATTNE